MNTLEQCTPHYYNFDPTTWVVISREYLEAVGGEADTLQCTHCAYPQCKDSEFVEGQVIYAVPDSGWLPIYCCSLLCIALIGAYEDGYNDALAEQRALAQEKEEAQNAPPKPMVARNQTALPGF